MVMEDATEEHAVRNKTKAEDNGSRGIDRRGIGGPPLNRKGFGTDGPTCGSDSSSGKGVIDRVCDIKGVSELPPH